MPIGLGRFWTAAAPPWGRVVICESRSKGPVRVEMRLALAAEGRAVKRAFLCRRAWTTDALAARQQRQEGDA